MRLIENEIFTGISKATLGGYMKNYLIILLILSAMLSGCASEPTEIEKATVVVNDFLDCAYNIEDYNDLLSKNDYYKYSLYESEKLLSIHYCFTEDGFKEFMGIKYIYRVLECAQYGEINIKLLSIEYSQVNDQSIDGKMFFDYSAEIEVTYKDGLTEVFVKKGKIKLLKDEKWQIDHIKETNFPLYKTIGNGY